MSMRKSYSPRRARRSQRGTAATKLGNISRKARKDAKFGKKHFTTKDTKITKEREE